MYNLREISTYFDNTDVHRCCLIRHSDAYHEDRNRRLAVPNVRSQHNWKTLDYHDRLVEMTREYTAYPI